MSFKYAYTSSPLRRAEQIRLVTAAAEGRL
jgi:hypothetical protein